MPKLEIKVKRNHPYAKLPLKASEGAMGYDLSSCEKMMIPPGKRMRVPTGISMEIPFGYGGSIQSRSGLSGKYIDHKAGIIDSDYRGNIDVMLHNDDNESPFEISVGMRIAQILIIPVPHVTFIEDETLSESTRGAGGFGSTGVSEISTNEQQKD